MEWSSSPSSIELKVMSCNDLKAFNFFQKLSVYVVVSIVKEKDKDGNNKKEKHQKQSTPVDREGDGNPQWKHAMRFDLKGDHQLLLDGYDDFFIEFDLRCEIVFGNKTIGEVRVPIKDLIHDEEMPSNSNGPVRFVSYQVRGPDGKPNGVLHFSYKIIHSDDDGSGGKGDHNNKIEDNAVSPLDYYPHGPYPLPGVEALYPSVEDEPPSLSEVYYPSVELEPPPPPPPPQEAYYSAPEFYYTVPPAPPPPRTQRPYYYPPPPPPHHHHHHHHHNHHPPPPPPPPPPTLFYNSPPVPYGHGLGSYGYGPYGLNDHSAIYTTTSTGQTGRAENYIW